jgi:hypothetical protein
VRLFAQVRKRNLYFRNKENNHLGGIMELKEFIETKLNEYAQKIVKGSEKSDELAFGQISFYLSLRRVLSGKATIQDVGMMDAINDTLQTMGIVGEGETFYKK